MRGLKRWLIQDHRPNLCRIFYRCVDWNSHSLNRISLNVSRIFYRCVDWNNKNIVCRKPRNVASFTDAWIETVVVNIVNWVNMSHLLQMRGLKHSKYLIMTLSKSRIFYRCVDWNAEYILVTFKAFCRIFYRCVDWNLKDRNLPLPSAVASFTDAWIETIIGNITLQSISRRIFYRCVDWN